MKSASLDMLEESLVKKLDIMKKIQDENSRQKDILSSVNGFDEPAFDKTLEIKGEYIEQLISLDEGFQSLFDRMKERRIYRTDQENAGLNQRYYSSKRIN